MFCFTAGCVTLNTGGARVVLRDGTGADVTDSVPGNGDSVCAIQLIDQDGNVEEEFGRNKWGTFFSVFQPNKWELKRAQLADSVAPKETLMT
jgi:hypothetical protein